MRITAGFGIAIVALGRNLLRSALAMIGLIIGVAAVLTMVALGRGARESVTEEVSSAGTNLVFVRAGNYTRGGDSVGISSGYGKATTLTVQDALALADVPGVERMTPEVDDRASLASSNETTFATVLGCGQEVVDVYELELSEGRLFDSEEETNGRPVIILGDTVTKTLFPEEGSAIGRTIEMESQSFEVIGVLTKRDETFDGRVLVPYKTLQRILNIDYLHGVTVSTEQAGDASKAMEDITALLRLRHGLDNVDRETALPKASDPFAMKLTGEVPNDFTVRTQATKALSQGLYTTTAAFVLASMPRLDEVSSEEMVNTLTRANGTMTLLLAGIACVSLVVGGIGIMNIMLLAVTERTKEVGLRMSVGARRSDVLSQFMLEAILLSLLGGILGIASGFLSASALTRFLGWPTYISSGAVLLAFGLAFAVGVSFGYYPALRAARLDPIKALRYE